MGRLGLRNQYTLTILGLNIAILALVSYEFLRPAEAERYLIAIAVLAYLLLGPIVFMGPLLPFRNAMRRTKATLMSEVTERLRTEFEQTRANLRGAGISKEDVDSLERLRKLGSMIDELPVWPFDARTLRTFGSAYVVPVALPMLSEAVVALAAWVGKRL